tara:strand:- start:202 stop:423 length:222 start_codon:yes stop_codon:yes gene_type:complete
VVEEGTEVLAAAVRRVMRMAAEVADTAAAMVLPLMEMLLTGEVLRIQDRTRPIPQVHAVDTVRSSLRIYPVHP